MRITVQVEEKMPACRLVKVVKVKMVIFIFGLCHLLTIYKYNIYIIVAILTH